MTSKGKPIFLQLERVDIDRRMGITYAPHQWNRYIWTMNLQIQWIWAQHFYALPWSSL